MAVVLISPVLLLAWYHHVFAVGYFLFPYITPFVLVEKKQDNDKKPSA